MRGGVQLRLWALPLTWAILLLLPQHSVTLRCQRAPEGRMGDRSPVDGRFFIKISGSPDSYIPNAQYTVSIQGQRNAQLPSKFAGFLLVTEPESKDPVSDSFVANQKQNEVGTFQTLGDSLTKYSEKCPNAITHSSSLPKSEIQALWTAPPPRSGCVTIKATVIEHHDIWFMDDGPLSKTLCENIQESFDMQPPIIAKCCACDEAKYEVTFEGLWSRHTHPKDFPLNEWLTRFSDVIGASHTAEYRFWDYGRHASEGLRQLAEHGATRVLESELKAEVGNKDSESNHIRTIIKARGISYPNLAGKTFAVFRVDSRHHLMSLVSMINPSPDWIVGVSGLELCQPNCSWVESKVLNLYPWDVGTDSGPTYNSPDQPTTPRDVIRRIRTNFPNDPRSPFYEANGAEMKPLARLYLSRQRLYEKSCDSNGVEGREDDGDADPCAISAWSEYSPCSVTCGKGHKRRQRWYRAQFRAETAGCTKKLSQTIACHGARKHCRHGDRKRVRVPSEYEPDPARRDGPCGLTEWTSWSSCSSSCGWGHRVRSRKFRIKGAFKRCFQKLNARPDLQQTENCVGVAEECPQINGETTSREVEDSNCPTTPWSDWMECSVTCGKGIRMRTRKLLDGDEEQQDMAYTRIHEKRAIWSTRKADDEEENADEEEAIDDEERGGSEINEKCAHVSLVQEVECEGPIPSCEISEADARLICSLPKVVGPCRGYVERWFFDYTSKTCEPFGYTGCQGNRNNFETHQQCMRACGSYKEDLKRLEEILNEGDDENSIFSTNQTLYDVPLQDDDTDTYYGRGQFGGFDTGNHKLTGDVPLNAKVTGDGSLSGYDGSTIPPHLKGNNVDDDSRENGKGKYGKGRGNNKDRRKPSRNNGKEARYRDPEEWKNSEYRRRNQNRRNGNNEEDIDSIIEEPVGQIKKCEVTPWSGWSECSATCGRGFEQMSREIIQHPINGGRSCPKKLLKRRRCRNLPPCYKHHGGAHSSNNNNNENDEYEENVDEDVDSYESMNPTWGPGHKIPNVRKDCILSNWSPWSPCTETCGEDGIKQRTRSILRMPSNGGAPCGSRIDRRSCDLMPCPL